MKEQEISGRLRGYTGPDGRCRDTYYVELFCKFTYITDSTFASRSFQNRATSRARPAGGSATPRGNLSSTSRTRMASGSAEGETADRRPLLPSLPTVQSRGMPSTRFLAETEELGSPRGARREPRRRRSPRCPVSTLTSASSECPLLRAPREQWRDRRLPLGRQVFPAPRRSRPLRVRGCPCPRLVTTLALISSSP